MTLRLHVDAVLFDSDGVLVDSHDRGEIAWRQLAGEFELDFEVVRTLLAGVPARQTLATWLGADDDRLPAADARLEDLEVETATGTPAIPGACEFVAALPSDRCAFVTSASRRLAMARWEAAAIPVPECIVTVDDVTRGKPDPEPFVLGAERLGLDPSRCLVFEDSDAGGRAAVAAGATVVAVGAQVWSIEPSARVPDLMAARVAPGTDGFALTIEIDAAHAT